MTDEPVAVLVSGHMIDTPDRTPPRFPPSEVDRVAAEIEQVFSLWGVGSSSTVLTGGARGADILAAEAALERGAHLVLCLAQPPAQFERKSVALPCTDWAERFRNLLRRAAVEVVRSEPSASSDIYAATNARLLDRALERDPHPHMLLVWNGEDGDGPGGTRDLVGRLGGATPHDRVRVIDPTPRRYQARQTAVGKKKLLALDGGGVRGVLTLEILRSIEGRLRQHYGHDLVLGDYFDYIGGTSTGAIIAAALAHGHTVEEIQNRYQTLGRRVFRKRLLPMWVRSLYRDKNLTRELDAFFGTGLTLGDPDFRSLLLLVLHNTITDSAWPLSNCTHAHYNRADRYLESISDRNLDLPLTKLIRGSTAAPIYFPPESMRIGGRDAVFQDGGLTPFNNPALLMFLMATLPEYGLNWRIGEENMLIVSVGTGSTALEHSGLRSRNVDVFFNARNLPAVLMHGASVGQDLICRSLGRCLAGAQIDREFGARLDAPGITGRNLFTYLRYDADLSDQALARAGITARRDRQQTRKLDAIAAMPRLRAIGKAIGEDTDLAHFEGFL